MTWWRDALGTVGDVAKFALPAAAFIPGVNVGVGALAAMGAAAGAAGKLNDRRQDGSGRYQPITMRTMAPGAVGGAGAGYGAGRLGGGGSQGDALQRLLQRGGGAVDWLTDKDQGAARTALLTSALSTGAGIMGGRAQGAVEDDQLRYDRGRDTIEDARREKVLELLMSRMGGR